MRTGVFLTPEIRYGKLTGEVAGPLCSVTGPSPLIHLGQVSHRAWPRTDRRARPRHSAARVRRRVPAGRDRRSRRGGPGRWPRWADHHPAPEQNRSRGAGPEGRYSLRLESRCARFKPGWKRPTLSRGLYSARSTGMGECWRAGCQRLTLRASLRNWPSARASILRSSRATVFAGRTRYERGGVRSI